MTRRLGLLAIVGLLSGVLIGMNLTSPAHVEARVTKAMIKKKARQLGKTTKTKWEDLSPEEQQQVKAKLQTGAENAQKQWDAMSAEEQQTVREKTKASARRLRKKWKNLPAN